MTEENDFYKVMWDQKAKGEIIKKNNPLVAVKELQDATAPRLTHIDDYGIYTGILTAGQIIIDAGTTFAPGYDPTLIQVGGRNLLKGTATNTAWWSGGFPGANTTRIQGKITVLVADDIGCYAPLHPQLSTNFDANNAHTLSVDLKLSTAPTSGATINLEFRDSVGTQFKKVSVSLMSLPLGVWTRVSVSVPSTVGKVLASMYSYIMGIYPVNTTIEYRNLKLELGSKATDWTPAPEDVAADIAEAKAIADNSIQKATLYNGVSIDSANGLVATRSDTKVKSSFNATDGIKIQQNTGTVGSPVWTDKFFVDLNGILNLADIIASGQISVGGIGNVNGVFRIKDASGLEVVKGDNTGLLVTTGGATPFTQTLNSQGYKIINGAGHGLTISVIDLNPPNDSIILFNITPGCILKFLGNIWTEDRVTAGSINCPNIIQSAWIPFTFQNGWTNKDATHPPAGYMKDSLGFVHLRGTVASGTLNNAIATLPVGYRPATGTSRFSTTSYSTSPGWGICLMEVQSGGIVAPLVGGGGTGENNLDGIIFKAEN